MVEKILKHTNAMLTKVTAAKVCDATGDDKQYVARSKNLQAQYGTQFNIACFAHRNFCAGF